MTYGVIYEVNGEMYTATITASQYGEAYNWMIEDACSDLGCEPKDVKIHTVIEMM